MDGLVEAMQVYAEAVESVAASLTPTGDAMVDRSRGDAQAPRLRGGLDMMSQRRPKRCFQRIGFARSWAKATPMGPSRKRSRSLSRVGLSSRAARRCLDSPARPGPPPIERKRLPRFLAC